MNESVYDFSAKANDGSELRLSQFRGRPLLIVNTASKCGFTPQYKGLQKLYEDYGNRGLEVIGFPATSSPTKSLRATRPYRAFASGTSESPFPSCPKSQ